MSRGSGFSTASAVEFRKSANCRGSPIARNYHSKINRSKEAKRIDEENLVSWIFTGSGSACYRKIRKSSFIKYVTIFRLCYEGYKM